MRRARLLLASVLVALAVPGAAHAAVGADNYGDAAPLLFSAPGTLASSVGYTTQTAEPVSASSGCDMAGASMTRTAWWRFTGTGRPVTLTTMGSDFDTVLAVYETQGGPPLAGNRLICNNNENAPLGITTSALTFTAARGTSYLVQVAGRGPSEYGSVALRASASRPANDDRISATPLVTGALTTVDNTGASQELGETTTCTTASFAATIWFSWTASAVGDAVFSSTAAFGDTVVTVYRASDGAALGCNAGTTSRLPLRVAAGDYLIQVATKGSDVAGLGTGPITTAATLTVDPDVDRDGDLASTDCDDTNPAIRHGVVDTPDDGIDQDCNGADAVNLDRDGDGETRPGDCNDANPAIRHGVVDTPDDGVDQDCSGADSVNLDRDRDGETRPGDCNDADPRINHAALDVPGNAVDEDCSGSAAPFPRVASTVRTGWRFTPFGISKLAIVRSVPASHVEIRCKGRGCPFKRERVAVRTAKAELPVLSAKLKRAHLRRGVVLEVRITQRGHVGFMRRLTVTAENKDPKIAELCLPVGGAPTRC